MASKGHKDMSQTVLATRQSIITYTKEHIQPKIKEWEKEIKKYRKQKDLKKEKQLNILFDLLSRMTDQVKQFQSSLGYTLYEVCGDLLKEKSKTVSEDMEKKLAEWHILLMRTETQDKLEQHLSLFLTQVQWWTEKLTKMTSMRQQTPQQTDPRGSVGSPQSTQDGGNEILQEKNTKLQKEVSDLQMKYDSKVAENYQRKKDKEYLMEEIDQLKKYIDEQRKEVKAMEREKDELLNRRVITDLCSEVRPIKIAEQFKEIYDNQWADAFEELRDQGYPEVTAIQILKTTVDDSFQFTADMAKRRLDHLETSTQISVLNTTQKIQEPAALSEECADLVKQLRRASVQTHVVEIQKGFIETQIPKHPPENVRESRGI